MYYSLSEIFDIGIGPSSSHTVGPMKAAKRFVDNLKDKINEVSDVKVYLYGSLALTGIGHGTLNAVMYGLLGYQADKLDLTQNYILKIKEKKQLLLGKVKNIDFEIDKNFILEKKIFLPEHPNGMKFAAYDANGNVILEETYFSVGGGTIARNDEIDNKIERKPYDVPYQFSSFNELRKICVEQNASISEIILANERALRSDQEIFDYLKKIIGIMSDNIDNGINSSGILPGGLKVPRRAPIMYQNLHERFKENTNDSLFIVDWVNLWAFAVAEENASGGKIVTAPTMGSAGIMPADRKSVV